MRVLIALSVLAVLAASARAAEPLPGAAPAPGPGCSMLKDKHSCKDSKDGCTWCESSFSSACYSEDQAKYLPAQFFHCKPKPSASSEEGAPAQPELAKKGKGGDKKADCRDLKDRKDCVRARAVCSWCKGSFAPDMCLDEDQAKYLPPMVFDCEKSRHSKADDDDDEVDVSEFPASLDSKKHKKHDDDDDKPGCRDLKDRKHCIKSKAVCGWCESKIGPDLCLSETAAKLMPPIVYKCEESRVKPDPDTLALKSGEQPEQPEQGNADEDADEDASGAQPEVAKKSHKKHRKHDDDDDDKKADCRDLKDRKDCVRASAVCSWCKGTFAPDMCLQEDQARYLPPFVFDCEKSRRSKDDDDDEDADEDDDEDADADEDDDDDYAVLADLSRSRKHHKSHHEGKGNKHRHADKKHRKKHDDDDKKKKKTDCRDLKDRKDCVRARAVCSWCKGTFAPDMCLDEAQARYLPPFVFSCEASRRSKDDADDDVTAAAVDESKGWVATVVDVIRAPFSAPEPGPSDPCTDYGSAKKCGRHDGCTWCEGKWAAGQCFSEERAKYLPSSFFKCDVSKVAAS